MSQQPLDPGTALLGDTDPSLGRTSPTHEPSWPDVFSASATDPADESTMASDETPIATLSKKHRRKRVTAEHTRQRVRDNQRRHRAQQRLRLEELESLACENKATIDQLRAELAAIKSELERCGRHDAVLTGTALGIPTLALASNAAASNIIVTNTSVANVTNSSGSSSNISVSAAVPKENLLQPCVTPLRQLSVPNLSSEMPLVRYSSTADGPTLLQFMETPPLASTEAPMMDPNPRFDIFPMTPPEISTFMDRALARANKSSCSGSKTTCCTDNDLAIISRSFGSTPLSLPFRSGNNNGDGGDGSENNTSSCVLGPRCCADDLPPVTDLGSVGADTNADDDPEEADESEDMVCSQPEIHGPHLPKKILQAATAGDSGTTPCTQAVVMVVQQNFKGVSKQLIESWLEDGFRRAPNEEGCRIENGRLYSLLAFMSE
ncbi:hypothetical protein CFIMG_007537RA00001 [Ceratocystis fimbriata CBS 114723]|uniref:BZIP domain-containing protein n=1 Tax=Ceratocystis fimbriata CBS 114723 TaxID=1035309 RepID=A0A2C5WVL8_9PEZI|nr:hypothetical protein CFIMG_007537RA00001 [Ceratocystis fimbriata CBS 114723]